MISNNILDVLTYMFDYLFETESASEEINDKALKEHLTKAGFDKIGIDQALSWLDNIAKMQDKNISFPNKDQQGMRIYTKAEKEKINIKNLNFLYFMEHIGQLTASQREMVVSQAMSLGEHELSLSNFKWVVIMVLGNSTGDISTGEWIENIVLDDPNSTQH